MVTQTHKVNMIIMVFCNPADTGI